MTYSFKKEETGKKYGYHQTKNNRNTKEKNQKNDYRKFLYINNYPER